MNTLPRVVIAQILNNPQTYPTLRQHWRSLMNSEQRYELKAEHHLLYLALCGKDWRKGFTPVSNRRKLENGAFYGWEMFRALARIHAPAYEARLLAPFAGVITPNMLRTLRPLLPKESAHHFKPADFAAGSYPFTAYLLADLPTAVTSEKAHG